MADEEPDERYATSGKSEPITRCWADAVASGADRLGVRAVG
jgi:hypothetical protein